MLEVGKGEIFDMTDDALQAGTIHLVPCLHSQSSMECNHQLKVATSNLQHQHSSTTKQHPIGQKSEIVFFSL